MSEFISNFIEERQKAGKIVIDARKKLREQISDKKVEVIYDGDFSEGVVVDIDFANEIIEIQLTDVVDWSANRVNPNGNPIIQYDFTELRRLHFKLI